MSNDDPNIAIGRVILEDLLLYLAEKQSEFHPCQVALSVFYPREDNGKYLLFSPDVFPILYYLHPLAHVQQYNESRRSIMEGQIRALWDIPKFFRELKPTHFARLTFGGHLSVKHAYQALRSVTFEGPLIMGKWFKLCIELGLPQFSDSLTFAGLIDNQIKKSKTWELGCLIEKALFLAPFYPQYTCTFFNLMNGPVDQVLCITLFSRAENHADLGKLVLDFMRTKHEIVLLDEIADRYKGLDQGIEITSWDERTVKFRQYLDSVEQLNAELKTSSRGKLIARLEQVIELMDRLSLAQQDATSALKLAKVDEFLRDNWTARGTPPWLEKLTNLQKELE